MIAFDQPNVLPFPWAIVLPKTRPVVARPANVRPVREAETASERTAARHLDPARAAELERERILVERAHEGDRHALATILRTYGPQLYRSVLLPRLGSEGAAQEALSATYEKIVEKLHLFTWQSVGIYPWMRVVGMRIALDQLRARKREVPFDTDDLAREVDRAERTMDNAVDGDVIARQDAAAAHDRIERALETLHPRYARAIRMRVLEERPREDVARELGVTVATFDVVLHRALAAMKKALLAEGAEEETP